MCPRRRSQLSRIYRVIRERPAKATLLDSNYRLEHDDPEVRVGGRAMATCKKCGQDKPRFGSCPKCAASADPSVEARGAADRATWEQVRSHFNAEFGETEDDGFAVRMRIGTVGAGSKLLVVAFEESTPPTNSMPNAPQLASVRYLCPFATVKDISAEQVLRAMQVTSIGICNSGDYLWTTYSQLLADVQVPTSLLWPPLYVTQAAAEIQITLGLEYT